MSAVTWGVVVVLAVALVAVVAWRWRVVRSSGQRLRDPEAVAQVERARADAYLYRSNHGSGAGGGLSGGV